MTLRHAGVLVKNLERARKEYEKLGFKTFQPVELLTVLKMIDQDGQVIELVQGNWHPHIAVNWFEDMDGNYIEVVKEGI